MESILAVVTRALANVVRRPLAPVVTRPWAPPENMSDELYRAAQSGDWGTIQRSPDYKKCTTASGNNVLHVLAQAGDSSANAVQQILAEKPSLAFRKNRDAETPLVIASRRGYSEVVRQLVTSRPRPLDRIRGTVGNDMRSTAVLEAIRFNRSEVVKLFLQLMPELFQQEPAHEETVVDMVLTQLTYWLISVLFILKRRKMKIYVESPLYLAVEKKHRHIVEMILTSSCKSIACHGPNENLTALHAAAIRNSPACLKMISDNIPHRTLMGIDGWTPLHYAAELDHKEIVKRLLSLDKSMGYAIVKNDECKTALHIAVIKGHLGVIQEIIEQCPQSWEMVTDKRHNLLHLAIQNEKIQVLEWILGCSWASELINKKDVHGNTPLHLSLATKNLVGHNNLVNHPCVDMNPLNKAGLSPLDMVTSETGNCTTDQRSIMDELDKAGATTSLWRINIESETVSGDDGDGSKNSKTHMLVATLILTVAFGAGFTVPGGYDSTKEHLGMPVLGKKAAFIVFVVSDSVAMLLSIIAVQLQLVIKDKALLKSKELVSKKFPSLIRNISRWIPSLPSSKACITFAMISLVVAFISGLYAFMPVAAIKIYLLSVGSLFCIPLVLYALYAALEDQALSRQAFLAR